MGEVGGSRLSTIGGTPAERRQEILETTHQAVKRCQLRYGGMQQALTRVKKSKFESRKRNLKF